MDAFYLLAVLACPVGMGAMMWFMMKGSRPSGGNAPARQDKATGYAGFRTDPREQEVAALRAEVADLRARLDQQGQPQNPAGERAR